MIKDEWKHNPVLYLKALVIRCLNQELNISPEELEYADTRALSCLYEKNVKLTTGLPVAFPDSENIEPLLTEIAQQNMEGVP